MSKLPEADASKISAGCCDIINWCFVRVKELYRTAVVPKGVVADGDGCGK